MWFQEVFILPPKKVIGNSWTERVLNATLLEEKYEAKLEIPGDWGGGGEGVQNEKPSVSVWIFSGTTHTEGWVGDVLKY